MINMSHTESNPQNPIKGHPEPDYYPRPVLRVEKLKKYFPRKRGSSLWKKSGLVKAVDGISFQVGLGETFGLVGESGCGKSTTGKLILRVLDPTEGRILFRGNDIGGLKGENLLRARRDLQAVYQDPYSSLNPRMRIDHIVGSRY